MAIGSFNRGFNSPGTQAPMAEINTTPLVDVMLVLLIIFIITAPLMMHSVQVNLPRASSAPTVEKVQTLAVSITADGLVAVNGDALPRDDLQARFAQAVARDSEVELHLMVDREARYEAVADAMSAARRAGVARIGFVTQPR